MTMNTESLSERDRDMLLSRRDVVATGESMDAVASMLMDDYCTRTARYAGESAYWARLGASTMAAFLADVRSWARRRAGQYGVAPR